MQQVNDCFSRVKKDCFKFISSQETKKYKFRNKERMIKSFLIPTSQWISNKVNKKKNFNNWLSRRTRFRQNNHFINFDFNID